MTDKLQNGAHGALADDARAAILAVPVEWRVGSSICPTGVARRAAANKHETDPDGWRCDPDAAGRAARDLVRNAGSDILRKGTLVEPAGMGGMIRLRLHRSVSTDSEKA